MKLPTIVSLVPGGGAPSMSRGIADTGSDFGSVLNGFTEDKSAGTSLDSPGSQVAAAKPTGGASLLTLAARAVQYKSVPTLAGTTARTSVKVGSEPEMQTPDGAPQVGVNASADAGKQTDGAVTRKRQVTAGDDDETSPAVITIPIVPSSIAAATSVPAGLLTATMPKASAEAETSSTAISRAPAVTPTLDEGGTAKATIEGVASVAPIDSQIVADTVLIESHLGFRSSSQSVVQAPKSTPARGADTSDISENDRSNAGASDQAGSAADINGGSSSTFPGFQDTIAAYDTTVVAASRVAQTNDAGGPQSSSTGSSKATPADVAAPIPASPALPTADPNGGLPTGPAGSLDTMTKDVVVPSFKVASDASGSPVSDSAEPLVSDPSVSALPIAVVAAPVSRATAPLAQQVADSVVGLAKTIASGDKEPSTQVAPARTMALQLSPAGLGTLTVHLRVAGHALDVRLEASDGRTAALIDRDRAALSTALSGKDYQLQSLSVTTHDATMAGGTHAERGTDKGSTNPDSSASSRGDGGSGRRAGGGASRDAPRRPSEEAAMERGASSLFV